MKFLLIKPQKTIPKIFRGVGRIYPSIGLGYIAAVLKKNGHEVKILDAAMEKWNQINKRDDGMKFIGMKFDEIAEKIRNEKPDIVGITTLSVDAANAILIAKTVKNTDKNIKVIMGGCHVSVIPEKILKNENVDFIVIGEGDITIVELAEALEKNKTLKKVKGIAYKENGKIIINEPRPFIQNLDELPFPAWHLMNLEKYFELSKYLQGSHLMSKRHFSIITSRSCPYSCIFCSVRTIMGRGFRPRTPENVIEEMEQLINNYNIKFLSIEDDNLTFDRKRAEKIFDLMIERGINKKIKWDTPNGLRADTLDEPLLIKMKEAGAELIYVAPESGSQKVVNEIIGKNLDLRKVEEVVKICQKINLKIGLFFVIGLPGETKDDILKTIEFANKMRKLGAMSLCSIARPTFGTDLYKLCKEKGYLLKDDKELEMTLVNFEGDGAIKTPDFNPEELSEYAKKIRGSNEPDEMISIVKSNPYYALKLFFLHPSFIIKYILKDMS
jgi:magnesium-protoporphyrin IX monomethyl ester (oxidative) cyclase